MSGDPYVSHPLAVAEILGKLKMDQDCLSAAMLHDVIEDSGIPKTFLKKEFNKEVANLVDGVSKLDCEASRNQATNSAIAKQAA